MRRSAIPALILALLLAAAAHGVVPLGEAGALLPLQDRVGDPELAAAVEEALVEELSGDHSLVDPPALRDALRRLRIRDVNHASPALLDRLGADLGVDWFFSATVHQATQRRAAPPQAGRLATQYESTEYLATAGSVPQLTLSARVYRVGGSGDRLTWAGFEAASGLDTRRLLDLGRIDDLEVLGRRVARRLAASLTEPAADEKRYPPARNGFLRAPLAAAEMGPVAIVPFNAVTDVDPTVAAETVTELALSVFNERGVKLLFPGRVNEILRRQGVRPRGEVDAATRAALRSEAGAALILTGTVESWEVRGGGRSEPEPRVAFSLRLLDAESGRILWIDGQDRRGWDREGLFRSGRIYAAGTLAEEMMQSLAAGLLTPREQQRPSESGND